MLLQLLIAVAATGAHASRGLLRTDAIPCQKFVEDAYNAILCRAGDAAGIAAKVKVCESGAETVVRRARLPLHLHLKLVALLLLPLTRTTAGGDGAGVSLVR